MTQPGQTSYPLGLTPARASRLAAARMEKTLTGGERFFNIYYVLRILAISKPFIFSVARVLKERSPLCQFELLSMGLAVLAAT